MRGPHQLPVIEEDPAHAWGLGECIFSVEYSFLVSWSDWFNGPGNRLPRGSGVRCVWSGFACLGSSSSEKRDLTQNKHASFTPSDSFRKHSVYAATVVGMCTRYHTDCAQLLLRMGHALVVIMRTKQFIKPIS